MKNNNTKNSNNLLSTMSTSIMQSKKDRPYEAQAVGTSVSNSNVSRNVHAQSPMRHPEDKPRIRHASSNQNISSLPSPRPMNKPILEGLDRAPSAHIQIKGAGYENPRLRSVRDRNPNSSQLLTPESGNINIANSDFRLSAVKDYTYGLSKGKLQV